MTELQKESLKEDLWQDHQRAGEVTKRIEQLRNELEEWENLKGESQELNKFVETVEEDQADEIFLANEQYQEIRQRFDRLEKQSLFRGPYDKNSAVLSFQAGAGGTDAQDWAEMLMRMYLRWAERKDFEAKILEETKGTEAGIKSATVEIAGSMVFGHLKSEKGVHRLVRLSPFNSDHKRETSFAMVEVLPLIKNEIKLEINPVELRIDTFRSSGAGGQHVNTTDSAVRITHQPTGTVVSCQNQRSQLQNREKAMEILKARLVQRMEEEQAEKLEELKGQRKAVEWGSQIRSYVLHPYKMVKDHRTNEETANVEKVLEGNIDEFIEAYLRKQ